MIDSFHIRWRPARAAVRAAQATVALLLPSRVRSGPFRGARIHRNTFGSAYLPKLLGTYEMEIADHLCRAVQDPLTDAFLDIGCAGGFYLQAVSHLRPDIELIGIDANPRAARVASPTSHGARVTVLAKYADGGDIASVCEHHRRPVVLIDIEGGERELLSPSIGPVLRNAVVLIEVHEYLGVDPGALAAALADTHSVVRVPFARYGLGQPSAPWPSLLRLLLRHELRHPETSYLVAHPKA
jgi:hypothetical protein